MSTAISILKTILLFYLIIVVLVAIFQERLIFFPHSISNPFTAQFEEHKVHFVNEGTKLEGWFIGKDKISVTNPLIIYYGGNAEEVSGNLLDLNHYPSQSFLFMNYRGFGESEGKPSQENLIGDAMFIIRHLMEKEQIAPSEIILMGRSLGSGVAVQVAHQVNVRGVILVTPFDSLANVAKNHYPIFPINFLIRHPFDSIQLAPLIDTPALFLMGTDDKVISNERTNAIARAWKGPSTLIPIEGAGHNDIHGSALYWEEINRFILASSRDKQL